VCESGVEGGRGDADMQQLGAGQLRRLLGALWG
jgi:hypothetical protein